MADTTQNERGKHGEKYALPRNEMEKGRLDGQHMWLTETVGGRLIIDDTIRLRPGDRVLDAGTGTGSWILALSKHVPETVELVGVDLSLVMFPKEHPGNVKIHDVSVTNLPSEWSNSFDLISQRLVFVAFSASMSKDALSEFFRVLKSGGAIQLMEIGRLDSVHNSTELPATNKARDIVVAVGKKRGVLGADCLQYLPGLLREIGFSDVHVETHRAPLGKPWGENGSRGLRNCEAFLRIMGAACVAEGGLGACESNAEVQETVDRATKEWDENPGVFMEFSTITARKPV